MVEPWSDTENDLVVADYFAMLKEDVAGNSYNKAEHNRLLQQRIDRTKGSIEFKHQNVSAVLCGFNEPWISGYKPALNFQSSLVDAVWRWLNSNRDWLHPRTVVDASRVAEEKPLWIGPPPTHRNEPPPSNLEAMSALARKYDAAERDAKNRALGEAGEELVLNSERLRLEHEGRLDLAQKVRWTAKEDGDGYGYDILSFEANGEDRLLEVKTTNGWEYSPFHISRNELSVANERKEHWHLIRLWDFTKSPKAFSIRPPLENHAQLTATNFLAKLF
jgi:hypothetical protein